MRLPLTLTSLSIALFAVPVLAQPVSPPPVATPEPMPAPEASPVDGPAGPDLPLSAEAQTYAAGLSPERQVLFLRLTPMDRERLLAMTEADQAETWDAIEAIVAEEPVTPPASEAPLGPPLLEDDGPLAEPDNAMDQDSDDPR